MLEKRERKGFLMFLMWGAKGSQCKGHLIWGKGLITKTRFKGRHIGRVVHGMTITMLNDLEGSIPFPGFSQLNVEGMHKDNDYYYSLSICLRVEIIRILKLTTQEVP